MEALTPREFFEKVLPERFKPSKAAGVDITVQVSITGPNGGDWVITIKDRKLEVKEGMRPSPMLSLNVGDKDFVDLVNGKMTGELAFLTGKLQFKGNVDLALKLKETGFF